MGEEGLQEGSYQMNQGKYERAFADCAEWPQRVAWEDHWTRGQMGRAEKQQRTLRLRPHGGHSHEEGVQRLKQRRVSQGWP